MILSHEINEIKYWSSNLVNIVLNFIVLSKPLLSIGVQILVSDLYDTFQTNIVLVWMLYFFFLEFFYVFDKGWEYFLYKFQKKKKNRLNT